MPYKENKQCLDCHKLIYFKSTYCMKCRFKGSRNPFYGKKHPPELQARMAAKLIKPNAKYSAIHIWVNNHKGKASKCTKCSITKEERQIEWANVDHKYSRKLEDYIELCCNCHFEYDVAKGFKRRLWCKTKEEASKLGRYAIQKRWANYRLLKKSKAA